MVAKSQRESTDPSIELTTVNPPDRSSELILDQECHCDIMVLVVTLTTKTAMATVAMLISLMCYHNVNTRVQSPMDR